MKERGSKERLLIAAMVCLVAVNIASFVYLPGIGILFICLGSYDIAERILKEIKNSSIIPYQGADVGVEFHSRLVNKNSKQGDGRHTAVEFRERFLKHADNDLWWTNSKEKIVLDFSNVDTIGPAFANEAFAYFTKYASPKAILTRLVLNNISQVKLATIQLELDRGYNQ